MRIVRVIGVLEPGGAQLSALRLSAALRAYGVETIRLLAGDATPAGLELARRYDIPVEHFTEGAGLQWRPSAEFARWLAPRLTGADLVHAHMFGAWWAAARALTPGLPLLASEHNEMSWPYGNHIAAARQMAKRIDAFFAHGPAAWNFATSIGLGAGLLHHGRSIVEGLDARPYPGLARPRLTFTGRFRADKGLDVLLEALALLADPPAVYLVGDGPDRELLQRRVHELGLAGVVRMPGWSYEPARYVAGASVHVVPSREEAWSQSAVVALGLGVPVVGTAVDGLRNTLGEGRGVLVPPENPQTLAVALQRVLAGDGPNPALGRMYAAAFTPGRVARRYLRVYCRVVTTPRGGVFTDAATGCSPDPAPPRTGTR
jgi:glycosyltransferase involved in cell wall biosynthesis